MNAGERISELRVTPDPGLPRRYAEVSGDHNPIHTDEDFARRAGLPGTILHGLWTMAEVARAATTAAGGDPRRLAALRVQFRGIGMPGEEIEVSGSVAEAGDEGVVLDLVARQGGRRIVRGARAELRPEAP